MIPVFNHPAVLEHTVSRLKDTGLFVILVDDGSEADCHRLMENIAAGDDGVELVTHAQNMGKGAAIRTGLEAARKLGYTHALQVDADGQHDLDDAGRFLEQAKLNPAALVSGYPEYDDSVPRHRYLARYLTHIWVWINTLSFTIIDSMCGFRVYPVASGCDLLRKYAIGKRMQFDTEFIVYWYWCNLPIVQLRTHVTYPEGNTSRFRPLHDNVLISLMHTRLFFLMLPRIPMLLKRNLRRCRKAAA